MDSITLPVNYLFSFLGVFLSLVVLGPLAWIVKGIIKDQKQLAEDMNKPERDLPIHYVRRDDYQEFQRRIFEKLDVISDKLDKKADK